jgi:hypothetical protein
MSLSRCLKNDGTHGRQVAVSTLLLVVKILKYSIVVDYGRGSANGALCLCFGW